MDGRWIVSTSNDFTVKIWNSESGICKTTLSGGHNGSISKCAVSHDGMWCVTASADRTVIIWDIENSTLKKKIENQHTDSVANCVLSNDEKWIVTTGNDKTVKVFDLNGEIYIDMEDVEGRFIAMHSNNIYTFSSARQLLTTQFLKND